MNTRQTMTASGALIVAALLYSLALFHRLPNPMPIHWNLRGQVDGWCDRRLGALIMPATMTFLAALLMILPAFSPGQLKIASFRLTYNYLTTVSVALIGYVHVLVLQAAIHQQMDLTRALMGGLFCFFAVIGNVLGKVRRNAWMGVRTPWTLASDAVWIATHRFTARLWTAAGLLGAVAILIGVPVAICLPTMIAALLIPIPYSYLLYRRAF